MQECDRGRPEGLLFVRDETEAPGSRHDPCQDGRVNDAGCDPDRDGSSILGHAAQQRLCCCCAREYTCNSRGSGSEGKWLILSGGRIALLDGLHCSSQCVKVCGIGYPGEG